MGEQDEGWSKKAERPDKSDKKAERRAKSDAKKADRHESKLKAEKVKADAKADLLTRRGQKLDSWGGLLGRSVVLYERCIEHGNASYPIVDARASVDSAGGVAIARNRTLKTGLLHSKKTTVDSRVTHLTVETTEGSFVISESATDGGRARSFAARVNAQAGAQSASVLPVACPQVSGSLADELAKLAALRDSGVLTPAEFEVQKAKLLSS